MQLKKYRLLLLRFTHEDTKAQKYLIGGIEQVIALHRDILLPKLPAILKVFIVFGINKPIFIIVIGGIKFLR